MTIQQDSEVLVERTGAVLRITLNRPSKLNALHTTMLDSLTKSVTDAERDDRVRVVLLRGAGRAFSSGADVGGNHGGRTEPSTDTVDAANRLVRALVAVPKPVVAAVHGPAAGLGCSIALAADLVVAAESAYFLLAFANVGLMPDGGASALIPAAIGRARFMRMAMLPEGIPAAVAYEWGLISAVAPDDAFDQTVAGYVDRLAAGSTTAYAKIKDAVNAVTLAELPAALERERAGQAILLRSADNAEGIQAFRERRRPEFRGR